MQTAKDGDRVKVTRKESIDHLKNRKRWNDQLFTKGYINELRKVLPTLEPREKAFLMSIQPYISYFDCHLQYSNGKDIAIKNLVAITGYSRKTVIAILGSLVEKDILYRGKNSKNYQWFVNPWLFSRGKEINKVLKTMFQNYYIHMFGCKWKDLGD